MTPILVIFIVGIIEMSLLMRDVVATSSAVRVGARIASTQAGGGPGTCASSAAHPPPCTPQQAPELAQAAADAIQRAGSAMPKDNIEWIMVYNANSFGYPMPAGNSSQLTCSTDCVEYAWDQGLDQFVYQGGSWNSKTINACINDSGRMAVGIAMRTRHQWITGMFGTGKDITERSVMQFEPLPSDQCKPGTPAAHP